MTAQEHARLLSLLLHPDGAVRASGVHLAEGMGVAVPDRALLVMGALEGGWKVRLCAVLDVASDLHPDPGVAWLLRRFSEKFEIRECGLDRYEWNTIVRECAPIVPLGVPLPAYTYAHTAEAYSHALEWAMKRLIPVPRAGAR